ncbi:glucuronate isomerase [Paenibacillus psychroresistens]|uniref:Uronate isomerase n=1 Tax=Paenibacillus psychroresistens TaxID=1778678 RepID=A0A6B8RS22_9BACL|nr:glucuronate isomerase [Paenibacillus psychroresistens]QGQ98687.1 glucuronate isomerase [Paenibacillus psychroresistens]
MGSFMDENFLLKGEIAQDLYHNYAKDMPIIDYHCHLSPKEIYENKQFKNLTDIWLYGDHYKWKAMRSNGITEELITGNATDLEKFEAWVKTVPMTLGNPLYHWSHLELQRYFGVDEIIKESNAAVIWEKVNASLNSGGFGARDFIEKSNVKVICTTDDPTDSLEYHLKLKEDSSFTGKVLPSFRPDKGLEINRSTFVPWIKKLEGAAEQSITNLDELLMALEKRILFFHSVGCRISDHALDYVPYAEASKDEVAEIFLKAIGGNNVTLEQEKQYKTYIIIFIGKIYAKLNWTMQLHINAARNNSTRMFQNIGPDTGFDSINDSPLAYQLGKLLDSLDQEDALPKTILYSLNPNDYPVLATIMGSFQGGGIPGKIQFGSAWWFNDTKDGMLEQFKMLANMGLLSRFVGMLTDSRSFLSYTRHEYFRRLLCNLIGEWAENGEIPDDREMLGSFIQGICYNNAKEYFQF